MCSPLSSVTEAQSACLAGPRPKSPGCLIANPIGCGWVRLRPSPRCWSIRLVRRCGGCPRCWTSRFHCRCGVARPFGPPFSMPAWWAPSSLASLSGGLTPCRVSRDATTCFVLLIKILIPLFMCVRVCVHTSTDSCKLIHYNIHNFVYHSYKVALHSNWSKITLCVISAQTPLTQVWLKIGNFVEGHSEI